MNRRSAPNSEPIGRSENMRRIRSKDTAPELAVRRLLHALGYRYRLHRKDLPGKPDIVFPGRRKVIFVHGCFWHPHENCRISHAPKTNQGYWLPKLEMNLSRDRKHESAINGMGWKTLIVRQCEITEGLRDRLVDFLEAS